MCRATRLAKPGVSHVACSRQNEDAGHSLSGMTAADCAAAVSQPLRTSGSKSAASSFYELFLSYSANFAGGYSPNPAGSGYHWTLLPSRLKLSPAFAARVAARRAVRAAGIARDDAEPPKERGVLVADRVPSATNSNGFKHSRVAQLRENKAPLDPPRDFLLVWLVAPNKERVTCRKRSNEV